MQLADIILASAQASLSSQRTDGSFPPGHNGPYRDPEMPVRNTAHWLVALCKAYDHSAKTRFKDAASRATEYLLSRQARPMGASFFCRRNPKKDFSNGLIGQAWVIEALVSASEVLADTSSRRLAEEVFLLHPFDERVGLWQRVNVDGSYATFDMTFNHQLWFAAAGSLLDTNPGTAIGSRVIRFLDRTLASHLRIDRSGRIIHHLRPLSMKRRIAEMIRSCLRPVSTVQKNVQLAHKEIGYHAFNLYAFSILKQRIPAHPLWQSDKFASALRFVNRPRYVTGLENNRFAYPYNPPGFEVPFALFTFADHIPGDVEHRAVEWLARQLKRTFDFKHTLMQRNTSDPNTLAARIYEATRLPANLPIKAPRGDLKAATLSPTPDIRTRFRC